MTLEIYWDIAFLKMAMFNACTLRLTNELVWNGAKRRRIVAGALTGAALSVLVLLAPICIWVKLPAELLCFACMAWITFPIKTMQGGLKLLESYLACSVCWAGGMILIQRSVRHLWGWSMNAGMVLILEPLMLYGGVTWIRMGRKRSRREGVATIVIGEKKMAVKALVDSGNFLTEPISGKPVCVLDGREAQKLWGEEDLFRVIPWHGIGEKRGILKGYPVPELQLELGGLVKTLHNVYVAVVPEKMAKEEGRDCLIISPKTLEEP